MTKETKEYRKRLQNYLFTIKICKSLLENCFIYEEEFKQIEKKVSQKYGIVDGSLFK